MKCLERLDIYVIGDRQHALPAVARAADVRLKEKEATVVLPDHSRPMRGKVRAFRDTPNAGPNVPQQIRMIMRNPQTLDVGYFERKKIPVFELEERVRAEYPKDVQKFLQRDRRVRKMRPMELHHRPQTVELPTVDEWLTQSNSAGRSQ
jgi:hypothetical protein